MPKGLQRRSFTHWHHPERAFELAHEALAGAAVWRLEPGDPVADAGTVVEPVFVISFCFALLGVIVLAAFVRDRAGLATTALQRSGAVPSRMLPLLPLGTALVFLLAATAVGRLADRVGRMAVFLAGHVLLLGVYLLLLGPVSGYLLVVLTLALRGLFYAATDGVLMAHGGALLSEALRASGWPSCRPGRRSPGLASAVCFGLMLQYLAFALVVVAVTVIR